MPPGAAHGDRFYDFEYMTENKRGRQTRHPSNRPQKAPTGFAPRSEAIRLLDAILSARKPFDEVWAKSLENGALKTMSEPDRGLTRLIVMTTLRRLRHIDDILSTFIKKPLPQTAQSVRNILRTAIAQLHFLKSPPHAVLNIATSLAAMERSTRPFKGLINGVLRTYTRTDPEKFSGPNAASVNTPEWLHKRWQHQFGRENADLIACAHRLEPALDISVKADAQLWAEKLKGTLLPTGSIRIAGAGNPVKLAGFDEGSWWVQDAAASLPVKLMGDIAGRHVLDLCSAPGGKTAQLLAARAKVTAVERSPQRMKRLAQNLDRLGFEADLVIADAGEYSPPVPPDAILLDAPCTATGTIRRHPDVLYLKTLKNITDLAQVQKRLIDHAAEILKPGGSLLYCVCSLEHEEGEDQITEFLKKTRGFSLDPIRKAELPGLEQALQSRGDVRILPHFLADAEPGLRGIDGFYIARLIKS